MSRLRQRKWKQWAKNIVVWALKIYLLFSSFNSLLTLSNSGTFKLIWSGELKIDYSNHDHRIFEKNEGLASAFYTKITTLEQKFIDVINENQQSEESFWSRKFRIHFYFLVNYWKREKCRLYFNGNKHSIFILTISEISLTIPEFILTSPEFILTIPEFIWTIPEFIFSVI